MGHYEAVPLVGVGPIAFGMTRVQAHAAFGPPSSRFLKTATSATLTDAWHSNSFHVFYGGKEELVEYIELSRDPELAITCLGESIFQTPLEALVERFSSRASVDIRDPEFGYSFVFPALSLSLWRPVIDGPESIYASTLGVARLGYYNHAV